MITGIVTSEGRELTREEISAWLKSLCRPLDPAIDLKESILNLQQRVEHLEKAEPYSVYKHMMWGITVEHPTQACGSCGWPNFIGMPSCNGCGAVLKR